MEAFKYIVDVDSRGQISVPDIPQIKSSTINITMTILIL